jgi:lipid-A-disaccharide synthase-like uncharacterized protein
MKRRYMVIGLVLVAVLGLAGIWLLVGIGNRHPGVKINDTPPGTAAVRLVPADDSEPARYRVVYLDGDVRYYAPDDYADLMLSHDHSQPLHFKLLNITTPLGIAWVTLGLLGQVLFTGRMVVQWLVSEKKHRSVVPPVFWWMSLFGASMLITYFIWRKDIVGFLGQGTGWLIYSRNLWLIYKAKPEPDEAT